MPLRVVAAITALSCAGIADAQQRREHLEAPDVRRHETALNLRPESHPGAFAVIEWYRTEAASLAETRSALFNFAIAGPVEEIIGSLPVAADDDGLLISLRNQAVDRTRTDAQQLFLSLNESYFARLREVMPDRVAAVDRLERGWRRESQFAMMTTFLGANIDLVQLADETVTDPAARAMLDPALAEWEGPMDALLAAYEQSFPTWRDRRAKVLADLRAGVLVVDEAAQVLMEPHQAECAVLRLSEAACDAALAALPSPHREAFERGWYERKYAFIWMREDELGPLDAALAANDLPDDARDALLALRDEIERLRLGATARLDTLQRATIEPSYIEQHYEEWAAWYIARQADQTLRQPPWERAEEFTEEGRRFLEGIEALGERVRAALAQANRATTIANRSNRRAVTELTGQDALRASQNAEMLRSSFDPRIDHETLGEMLDSAPNVTEDQRTVIESLHEEYLAELARAGSAYRSEIEVAWGKNDGERDGRQRFARSTAFDEARARGSAYDATVQMEWRVARPRIEQRFADDAGDVLDEAQRSAWNRGIARLRREIWLPTLQGDPLRGGFPGSCDLPAAALEAEMSEHDLAAIAPTLDAFEQEAEAILSNYEIESVRLQQEYQLRQQADSQRADPATQAAVERMMAFVNDQRMRLLNLTQRTFDEALPMLSELGREAFEQAVGRRRYPDAYGEGAATIALRLIHEHAVIDESRSAALDQIESTWQAARRANLTRIESLLRTNLARGENPEAWADPQASLDAFRAEAQANPGVFMAWNPPGLEEWRERFLLDLRAVRRLRTLFAAEEIDRLPAALRLALAFDITPAK